MKKKIIYSIIFWIVAFGIFFFLKPAINFQNPSFYFYLAYLLIYPLSFLLVFLVKRKYKDSEVKTYRRRSFDKTTGKMTHEVVAIEKKFDFFSQTTMAAIYCFVGAIIVIVLFSLTGAKIFNAKKYANQLAYTTESLEQMHDTFDYTDGEVLLPNIDKDLAFKLAQAKLGDYGAQYTLDYENFTIISVERNNKVELLRVAPLEYSNFFVSLNRMNQGTIGYIEVNVITKEARLVEFSEGLKYMPSSILFKNLDRYIRFKYPGVMYDCKNFEIDNDGNPYWVIPTYKREIGVFGGKTPNGVILINPINGDHQRYKLGQEPEWVQRTVDERIIEEQSTNAFKYKNGWFNATFGQKKEVFQLSDGYNYFLKDGHTYYISCITSPNEGDQTSVGFAAINLKTKQAFRYNITGITEMRAREIAQNDERVKAQALDSTWPILISFHDIETYFIVLKNDVQAQKIVFMNADTGSLVAIGNTIEEAIKAYENLLAETGKTEQEIKTISGTVTRIRDLGSTIEFLIDGDETHYYVVNSNLNLVARFLKIGDEVTIEYKDYNTYNYVMDLYLK